MTEIHGMLFGKLYADEKNELGCSKPCIWLNGDFCMLKKTYRPECVKETEAEIILAEWSDKEPSIKEGGRAMKRWEAWEIELLKSNTPLYEISRITHRSVDSIRKKAREVGKTKKSNRRFWTEEEEEMVKNRVPVSVIVEKTGRTVSAITNKSTKLGVLPNWGEEE